MAQLPRFPNRLRRSITYLSLGVVAVAAMSETPRMSAREDTNARSTTAVDYARIPLSFEANTGQVGPRAQYLARGNGFTLLLESAGAASLALRQEDVSEAAAIVRLTWRGARSDSRATGEGVLPGTVNYLRGNDPAAWRTGVRTFEKVTYRDIYPNVDLVYYGNQRELEYDVMVNPGGDPRDVSMQLTGAERIELDATGDLVLHIGSRTLKHRKPIAFQLVNGMRRDVSVKYALDDNSRVSFDLGAYDSALPLVIDPVVVYSTYLNGSNDDIPLGIAVDPAGNTYVMGRTLSANFPIVAGAYDATFNGSGTSWDVFVTKLDASGAVLLYSTLVGGTGDDGGDGALEVDAAGHAYVTGGTNSADFPTTAGGYDTTRSGSTDAIVFKLNPTGSALVFSSYFGGSSDDQASDLAVDASGRVHLRGTTFSANLPTTAGAYDTTFNGGSDAFVTRFDATGSAIEFSTFIGGTSWEGQHGQIALDPAGNAYVTGMTSSADFPTTPGAHDRTFATQFCSQEAFAAKLSSNGSTLQYSTFIKGDYPCQAGYAIAVDASGAAYVTTNSTWVQSYGPAIGGQALISKVDPTGSSLAYSIKLPGHFPWGPPYHYWTEPYAVAIDGVGRAYVAGRTGSLDFPTTLGAWDRSYNQASHGFSESAYDAFLIRLAPDGAIDYSTFIGGGDGDIATALALDANDWVHLAGYTFSGWAGSTRFPTTAGAFDTTWTDSFISPLGPWRPAYSGFVMKMDLEGAKPATVSVSPASVFTMLGEPHCVTATVTDSNSQLVADVPVIFKLTHWFGGGGSSNTQPTFMSDASGQAQFCHTSTQMGLYTFDVRVDSNKDRFVDDDEPMSSASQAVFFGVSPSSGVYGGTAALSARVFSGTYGAPGKTVSFSVLGQPIGAAATDANGTAALAISLVGVTAGSYPSAVVATFAGDGSLPPASASSSLIVGKATPIVTWNPSMIQAGTPVGSAQLNATASTPGTFSYSMASGTVLAAGLHTITASFTPTDSANYNDVTLTRDISANYWTNASQPAVATVLNGRVTVADPTRNRVYVGREFGLDVLNATTHAVLASTPVSYAPTDIAIDLEGQRILTSDSGYSRIHVYDATTLAEIEQFDFTQPTGMRAVAFDGATGLIWTGNYFGLTAVDLNAPANAPGRVRGFPGCVDDLTVNTTTGYVYVVCADSPVDGEDSGVRVVDGDPSRATFGQVVGTVTLAPHLSYYGTIAVDGRRNEVYVGLGMPDLQPELFTTVAIIEGDPSKPTFNTRIGTLTPVNQPGPAPQYLQPVSITTNPVTGRVYVITSDFFGYNNGRAVLNVFDAASRDALSTSFLPHAFDYTLGHLAVDSATNVVYAGGYGSSIPFALAIQDTTVQSASTPAGNGVAPVTTAMTAVSLTFSDVTASGSTTATPIDPASANLTLPGQFSIDGAPAYSITTSASFTGPITLCFAVGIDDPDVFSGLVILHGVGGAWVPEGTTHDFANRQVCAAVTSLSPFVIGRLSASYQVQITFDDSKAFKAGGTAPVKIRLLNSAGANVSSRFVDVRATRLQRVSDAATATLQDAGHANADGNFRYDAGNAGYIYNLSTKGLPSGTYRLTLRAAGDNTTKTVTFQLR